MSLMISRRSNNLQMNVQSEPSLGWAGELLLAAPRAMLRAARHAWAVQREEKLLQDLSDHQLRDLGIRRDQISNAVRNGLDW